MKTASIYNCFLLKSQMAVSNPEIDMPMEINAGIRKSDTAAMPEIKSTFFVVRINGLKPARGLIMPSKEIRAAIPPVKSMLVKVCLKMTQPTIRILKYRKPAIQRANAANATSGRFVLSHK